MSKDAEILPLWGHYDQLSLKYDPELRALWYFLLPHDRPCFNLDLLGELLSFQHRLREVNAEAAREGRPLPVRFTIIGSGIPGVFNLGGDLKLFNALIQNQDKDGLFGYAKACIDVLYPNAVNFDMPMTTLSLVQGDALGGGFEAAISSNVVIAEESAKFGLPEVLFNLVPGMGAYSFLIRRTTPAVAEDLITSGEVLTARKMLDLGLIDQVVPDGTGRLAANEQMKAMAKRSNAHAAMGRIRRAVNPITYEELIHITRIWVDAALQLSPRDMRMIEALVQAQNRRYNTDPVPLKFKEGMG